MTPSKSTGDNLLPRVASGEPDAVKLCLDRHGPLVWSLVRSQLKDYSQAEDLVQEIFIDVWKSAARFNPEISSESNFIAVIARRRLIDRSRVVGRRPTNETIEDQVFPTDDASLAHVDLSDEARLAAQAVEKLRPEQKKVLVMAIFGGLSHSQIAANTGLPLGTVKSHVKRGLDRVRDLLNTSPQEVKP